MVGFIVKVAISNIYLFPCALAGDALAAARQARIDGFRNGTVSGRKAPFNVFASAPSSSVGEESIVAAREVIDIEFAKGHLLPPACCARGRRRSLAEDRGVEASRTKPR